MIKQLKNFELEDFGQFSKILMMVAEIEDVMVNIDNNRIVVYFFVDIEARSYIVSNDTNYDLGFISLDDLEIEIAAKYNATKYCEVA